MVNFSQVGMQAGDLLPIPGGGDIGSAVGGAVNKIVDGLGGSSHKMNSQAYLNAPNDKVTIFADTKYNGTSRSFAPGQFVWLGKSGPLSRDKISSIKVPSGYKIQVWTGRPPSAPGANPSDNGGRTTTFTTDQIYVGDAWNDKIDTIRVSRVNSVQNTLSDIGNAISGLGGSNSNQSQTGAATSTPGTSMFSKNWLIAGVILIGYFFLK